MKIPGSLFCAIAVACCAACFQGSVAAASLGSAFNYQGRLLESGAPATGRYDFQFALFHSETGGSPMTEVLAQTGVGVSNGLFNTSLDFGPGAFSGAGSWLEIAVRPSSSPAAFTVLAPRQFLSPTPYALYTLKAESLNGPLPDAQLSTNVARLDLNQTFRGTVSFGGDVAIGLSNAPASLKVQGLIEAAAFSGNGAGLSNISLTALSARQIQKLWRSAIAMVAVTNSRNDADFTGKGEVDYDFRIGKYEINNLQYAAFLNAIAADDPHSVYKTNMTFDVHGGILRSGSPGDYSYSVKPGMEHQPAVWMDFLDALRFCNWLHNGQPAGSQEDTTTEDGAYTLTAENIASFNILRNPWARFWLPSDDEWYKAAYYQPYDAGGDPSNYWAYPTRSNDAPFSEMPPGGENSANSCCETGRTATDVGAYVNSRSFYGAYDMAGNVQEWTEWTSDFAYLGDRRIRGGSWNYNEFYAKSTNFEFDTTDYPAAGIGFRIAGAADP
jgi:formylglycine-generating enzyme required for sulfatase activity